jgi:signal transduction histidine kinase
MLVNLIKNALEASPDDTDVLVSVEKDAAVHIVIENSGEVPPDIRDRFFDKYVTRGKHAGTGLGTYSARHIARAHGGDVTLDCSTPGSTRVEVTLPTG